jgi:hypothetical protein
MEWYDVIVLAYLVFDVQIHIGVMGRMRELCSKKIWKNIYDGWNTIAYGGSTLYLCSHRPYIRQEIWS